MYEIFKLILSYCTNTWNTTNLFIPSHGKSALNKKVITYNYIIFFFIYIKKYNIGNKWDVLVRY